jgi:hypothetical protein
MAAIDAALAQAGDADDVLNALVRSLEDLVEHDPGFFAVLFELFTISRRNQDVADELAELLRRTRVHLAEQLAAKRDEGTIELTAEPEAVASILFALADGLALRMLAEPEHDFRTEIAAAVTCVRALVV